MALGKSIFRLPTLVTTLAPKETFSKYLSKLMMCVTPKEKEILDRAKNSVELHKEFVQSS